MAKKTKADPKSDAMETSDDGLLRGSEAAKLIGIQDATFRKHTRDGKITPRKVVHIGGLKVQYYHPDDVKALEAILRPEGKRVTGRPRSTDA